MRLKDDSREAVNRFMYRLSEAATTQNNLNFTLPRKTRLDRLKKNSRGGRKRHGGKPGGDGPLAKKERSTLVSVISPACFSRNGVACTRCNMDMYDATRRWRHQRNRACAHLALLFLLLLLLKLKLLCRVFLISYTRMEICVLVCMDTSI